MQSATLATLCNTTAALSTLGASTLEATPLLTSTEATAASPIALSSIALSSSEARDASPNGASEHTSGGSLGGPPNGNSLGDTLNDSSLNSDSALSSSAAALATHGASTLDDAKLFSLFGSWLCSVPLASLTAASAALLASPCSSTLSGDATQLAVLDGSTPRDAMASALSLADGTLESMSRATLTTSADSPAMLCGSTSSLSSSAAALATHGASTLNDAMLLSLFGSWLRSSMLSNDTTQLTELDGSTLRDVMTSDLSLTGGTLAESLPRATLAVASAASPTTLCSSPSALSSTAAALAALGVSMLNDAMLFALFGSWLRSLPPASLAAASTISTFALNGNSIGSSKLQIASELSSAPTAMPLVTSTAALSTAATSAPKPTACTHSGRPPCSVITASEALALGHSDGCWTMPLEEDAEWVENPLFTHKHHYSCGGAQVGGVAASSMPCKEVTAENTPCREARTQEAGHAKLASTAASAVSPTVPSSISLSSSEARAASPNGASQLSSAPTAMPLVTSTAVSTRFTGTVATMHLADSNELMCSGLNGGSNLTALCPQSAARVGGAQPSTLQAQSSTLQASQRKLGGSLLIGRMSACLSLVDCLGNGIIDTPVDGALGGSSLDGHSLVEHSLANKISIGGDSVGGNTLGDFSLDDVVTDGQAVELVEQAGNASLLGDGSTTSRNGHSLGDNSPGGNLLNHSSLIISTLDGACARVRSSTRDGVQLNGFSRDNSSLGGSPLGGSPLNSARLNGSQLGDSQPDSSQLDGSQRDNSQLNSLPLCGLPLDGSPSRSSQLGGSQQDSSQLDSSLLNASQVDGSALNSSSPLEGLQPSLGNSALGGLLVSDSTSGNSHKGDALGIGASLPCSPCSIMTIDRATIAHRATSQEACAGLSWGEACRMAQRITSADPGLASLVVEAMQASQSSANWKRHQRRQLCPSQTKVSVLRCWNPAADTKRCLALYCGGKEHTGGIAMHSKAMGSYMELLRAATFNNATRIPVSEHTISSQEFLAMINDVSNAVMMLSSSGPSEQQQRSDDLAVAESLLDLSSTKERALEAALASVNAYDNEAIVRSKVEALGHALGTKRMESGSFKAIQAVLERATERHTNDKDAYHALGAKKRAYFHYKKLINEVKSTSVARAGIGGGAGSSASGPSAQDAEIGSQLPRLSSNHLGGITHGTLALARQRLEQHYEAHTALLEGACPSPDSGNSGHRGFLQGGVYLSPPTCVAVDTDEQARGGFSDHNPEEWIEFLGPASHLETADLDSDILGLMSSPEVISWLGSPESESASAVSGCRSGGVFGGNQPSRSQ